MIATIIKGPKAWILSEEKAETIDPKIKSGKDIFCIETMISVSTFVVDLAMHICHIRGVQDIIQNKIMSEVLTKLSILTPFAFIG